MQDVLEQHPSRLLDRSWRAVLMHDGTNASVVQLQSSAVQMCVRIGSRKEFV